MGRCLVCSVDDMGSKVFQQKQELRATMRKILSNLDERWLSAASRKLCKNLIELLNSTLAVYEIKNFLAWTKFFPGEVDLTSFVASYILDDKRLYLPRLEPDYKMTFISISNNWPLELALGIGGFPQPTETAGEKFSFDELEHSAVIVPGLAFDRDGNRLGRGKAYYDRFLADIRDSIIKIGVCWQVQLIDSVPVQKHDIPVDYIVTEQEILA